MNLKRQKEIIEMNISKALSSMVSKDVETKASYDMENDIVYGLLSTRTMDRDVLVRMVVYNCVYSIEKKVLTVSGFARRYGYDNFGINMVVNDPVTVDAQFIDGISAGIEAGLSAPVVEPEESSESEAQTAQE